MTRRTVLAVVICMTVVLAGCAGLGGGGGDGTATPGADATETAAPAADDTTAADDEATTAAEDTTTATEGADTTMAATATATTASTPGGTMDTTVDSMAGNGTFRFLAFEQPGTYTYEVTYAPTISTQRGTAEPVTRQGGNRSAEYVIDVVQASANQYEVQVSVSMDGMSNEQTFTGTRREVQQQMLGSQVGVLLAPLTPMTGFYGGRSLQVGQSWSYSSQQGSVGSEVTGSGSVSFEVTGRNSYAGIDCFVTEASTNGSVVHEACVSPDRGLAPYTAYYDESGTLTYQTELVSYEPG